MHAYNSKFILAFKCVGTNAVVVKRVHCISHGRLMDKKQLLNIIILHVLRSPSPRILGGAYSFALVRTYVHPYLSSTVLVSTTAPILFDAGILNWQQSSATH